MFQPQPQRRQWSTGCHACRTMKVKCDEAKPECDRCKRRGKPCPGYRKDSDKIFRSMNTSITIQVTNESQQNLPAAANTTYQHRSRQSSPIYPPLSTDWEQQAIVHFFDNYCYVPSSDEKRYLDFLPELAAKSPSTSCLRYALIATSMVYMANISSVSQLQIRSRRVYGKALQSLGAALQDPIEARTDQTLTAIVLLQKYEVFSGSTKDPWRPHENGLDAILDMRGVEHLNSPIGQSLFRLIQARRQVESLDGKTPQPPISSNSKIDIIRPTPIRAQYFRLLRSVALASGKLQAIISQLSTFSVSAIESNEALENALIVKDQLLSWPASLPFSWRYQTITPPSLSPGDLDRPVYNTKFIIFKDIHQGAMWIGYWCSVIALLRNLLNTFVFLEASDIPHGIPPTHMSKVSLRMSLLSIIDDLCASGPYMLGEIDEWCGLRNGSMGKGIGAFYFLRGLHVANMVEGVELDLVRRKWILDCLMKIGYSKGIRLALRSRKRWIENNQQSWSDILKRTFCEDGT
ncbi:hypothetical protein K469DRAFT_639411 [Zopfia rhizophila CBS 207.26]|uniref:Zn(2)-C6 fungal-type domain-containing protein n=1 Tax=Zopfia rhizophila CBS 207.26 TaxID=1314779 RepID=A0A6A6DN91_9PEZI|nr:hypothetical protein K469DRAFT_639411 [Zopfia rhizophila CBS 207.26]